ACHGIAAVVFAQLITGGVNHGVHAFYVPIREVASDGTLAMLPGVSSEDDGHKGGLNGIDNGRLAFDNVRVPRENMLNRYGDVAPDGTYSSPITSPGRRFFTMLGTLVQGRVSLSGASTVASKMALTTASRYGSERRQFVSTMRTARPWCWITNATSTDSSRSSPAPMPRSSCTTNSSSGSTTCSPAPMTPTRTARTWKR